MVKEAKNPQGNSNTSLNSPNLTSKLDSKLSKSRRQIYQENYQKNKEKKKQQRRERYQQQKDQAQQQTNKYYGAEAIKVLMSLKEYTELNQEKRKIWLDFVWTLKNLTDDGRSMSINNIIEVMRIRELAENLITDYWTTAKNEIRQGTQWNSLDPEQKDRLIKHWGYEKARKENDYLEITEQLEQQSREYLKEIELAKFHEERGKVKCPCYTCEQSRTIHQEVQKKLKQEIHQAEEEIDDYWGGASEKEECSNCGKWVKELDEENGICKTCLENYA